MNNNQKKLFNVANKIEKLLYSNGMSEFYKTTSYQTIILCLYKRQLNSYFIQELDTIIKSTNNLDIVIFVDDDGYLKLKIW